MKKAVVVPLGFEPRSEEPESSMMDRYTKGLLIGPIAIASSIQRYNMGRKSLIFRKKNQEKGTH